MWKGWFKAKFSFELFLLFLPRSVFVDRTLELVAKFACFFLEKEKEGENGEADAGEGDITFTV